MSGNLCEHCVAACCRYIALPIETPSDRSDFDDIRWYLIHENISVFVEDGEWFISMATPCRHLQADHRCGIYETRPQICRDYSTENCDYHSGDYGWEQHFTCPEHLDEYVQNVFETGRKRRRARRAAANGNGRAAQNGGRRRPRVKAQLGRYRRRKTGGESLTAASSDIAGIPLPILGSGR